MAIAVAMGQSSEKRENPGAGVSLRPKINQHSLVRRRKVSVPELRPMTTVQEVVMDSPTIPGRPPLRERSISVPEDTTKSRRVVVVAPVPVTEEDDDDVSAKAMEEAFTTGTPTAPGPLSPKHLAPFVIPKSNAPAPLRQSEISTTMLRSNGTPPLESSRPTRIDGSPMSRARFTPSASTPCLTYLRSTTTDTASAPTLPVPVSASPTESRRASSKPWDACAASERGAVPRAEDGQCGGPIYGHGRGASESSSVMDRGRPGKRIKVRENHQPLLKYSETKPAKSSQRREFKELPKGWKPSDALSKLDANDVATLRKQAYVQAERFEVLKVEDVEALSKELRSLDERAEFMRRIYTSLRAGRRNLDSRIYEYLRSPRVARFSHDSILKQEEALAELDASIDNWVTKLEQAENRRTRVRQKLLEHVAATTIIPVPGKPAAVAVSESLQQAPGMRSPPPRDISTPLRSRSKRISSNRIGSGSPSPKRVAAQVLSTILEHPAVEEAAEKGKETRATSTMTLKRDYVESICIYAGDDVYALLADVENGISNAREQALKNQLEVPGLQTTPRNPRVDPLSGSMFHSTSPISSWI